MSAAGQRCHCGGATAGGGGGGATQGRGREGLDLLNRSGRDGLELGTQKGMGWDGRRSMMKYPCGSRISRRMSAEQIISVTFYKKKSIQIRETLELKS